MIPSNLYFECTNNFGDTIKKKITKNKDYYQLDLNLESVGKYKFKVFSEGGNKVGCV